jgi:hypothetical protein
MAWKRFSFEHIQDTRHDAENVLAALIANPQNDHPRGCRWWEIANVGEIQVERDNGTIFRTTMPGQGSVIRSAQSLV